jgi:hypothetical protein
MEILFLFERFVARVPRCRTPARAKKNWSKSDEGTCDSPEAEGLAEGALQGRYLL